MSIELPTVLAVQISKKMYESDIIKIFETTKMFTKPKTNFFVLVPQSENRFLFIMRLKQNAIFFYTTHQLYKNSERIYWWPGTGLHKTTREKKKITFFLKTLIIYSWLYENVRTLKKCNYPIAVAAQKVGFLHRGKGFAEEATETRDRLSTIIRELKKDPHTDSVSKTLPEALEFN